MRAAKATRRGAEAMLTAQAHTSGPASCPSSLLVRDWTLGPDRVVSKNTNGLKTVAPGRFASVRRKRPWI